MRAHDRAPPRITGEGVFLPPLDQLVTNATWTYSSSGTMTMDAGGASISGSATNTANNTVAGFLASTDFAGGGTFVDVMSVLSEQTTKVSFGGVDTPAVATRTTLEFAKGIGLISAASAGDAGYSSMELISYTIP